MNMNTTPEKDPLAALVDDMEASLNADLAKTEDAARDIGRSKPDTPFSYSAPPRAGLGARPGAAAPTPPPAAEPAARPVAVAPTKAGGSSDVETFLANGAALHDKQRRKIIEMESTYEFDRVKLIDDYRVKLRDLEHEASEALRDFDNLRNGEIANAKRILDSITAMRG